MKPDIRLGSRLTLSPGTHHITGMNFDAREGTLSLTIETGITVQSIKLTQERVRDMGLINFKTLEPYLK